MCGVFLSLLGACPRAIVETHSVNAQSQLHPGPILPCPRLKLQVTLRGRGSWEGCAQASLQPALHQGQASRVPIALCPAGRCRRGDWFPEVTLNENQTFPPGLRRQSQQCLGKRAGVGSLLCDK